MFFHKTRQLATVFALTATALTIGTAFANGERQDNYCDEGDTCTIHYAGIVQKKRDGVNYFYGSSDQTFTFTSYQILPGDTMHSPDAAPDEFVQPKEIIQYVPYGDGFRTWHHKHHKMKPGHKADRLGFLPQHFSKSQFRHRNKLYFP